MFLSAKFKHLFLLALLAGVPFGADAATASVVSMEDAFSPQQGATNLILSTIYGARVSIEVAAYTFTSRRIAWALVKAHDRDIDVRVVLDKRQTGRRSLAGFLADHDIPVRINRRYAIMHDKFMVIDGATVELGSFNYTRSAEMRNAENVLVIHNDRHISADYHQQWQKLWGEAAGDRVASN